MSDDSLTAPLEGLCPTPLYLMSAEELREWVVKIQQLRTSHQTFKATMEKKVTKTLDEFMVDDGPKKKPQVLDEFL